jgi:hypothetical protein
MSTDRAATETELILKKAKKFIKKSFGKETKKSKQKKTTTTLLGNINKKELKKLKELFGKVGGQGKTEKKGPDLTNRAKGGIVKKNKGGLMVKPKAAKRGY